MWPLLLQSVLKGKAQEAYSALSVTDCSDYVTVKASILRAYELVPEAYRQKFRHYRKQDNQTYVEFAHEKEVYFDRWCNSKEIKESYENLKQLILIEEFKRCVRDDIKTYLDEKNVETLQKAATVADDFALTHKSFHKSKQFVSPHKQGSTDVTSDKSQSQHGYRTQKRFQSRCFKTN